MKATFFSLSKGKISLFLSKTALSSAHLRAKLWCSSTSNFSGALFTPFSMVSKIISNNLSTLSSNTDSCSLPSSIAFNTSSGRSGPPGISNWLPHSRDKTPSLLPPQSVTTKPSNPHSLRRISTNKCLFSLA